MIPATDTAAADEMEVGEERLLSVENLSISFGGARVVDQVSFGIPAGEVFALVGESGSGKTVTARAILRLLAPGAAVTGGRILFDGGDILQLGDAQMRAVRGARIGMVFQEPMTSLNPALTIGFQLTEAVRRHHNLSRAAALDLATTMLHRVRITKPEECLKKYPHEFSGGMRQRILIASILMTEPKLIIADEPTTALDVLVQREVLEILLEATRSLGTALLLITHDLGVVAKYAHRVGVMRGGRLLECGSVDSILMHPRHEYTRKLLESLPRRGKKTYATAATGEAASCLISADAVSVEFAGRRGMAWRKPPRLTAVCNASITVERGQLVALVGESGSGKTTLARALLGLTGVQAGSIRYCNQDITRLRGEPLRQLRQRLQMVFQDPYSALDPRMKVGPIIEEGLRHCRGMSRQSRIDRVAQILAEVGLSPSYLDRFPHELSGGQRQRVNIARALVSNPEFVVADEPVSALDITVQSEILSLFERLRASRNFSCLFISHDLSVVEQIAEKVVVMYRGSIVEQGSRDQIFDSPNHPYTRALLAAAPRIARKVTGGYELSDPILPEASPPEGYSYDGWEDSARRRKASFVEVGKQHYVACCPVETQHL